MKSTGVGLQPIPHMGYILGKVAVYPHYSVYMCMTFFYQARKLEDLGSVNLDDEASHRQERYYVPNWFSVEVKTGVS